MSNSDIWVPRVEGGVLLEVVDGLLSGGDLSAETINQFCVADVHLRNSNTVFYTDISQVADMVTSRSGDIKTADAHREFFMRAVSVGNFLLTLGYVQQGQKLPEFKNTWVGAWREQNGGVAPRLSNIEDDLGIMLSQAYGEYPGYMHAAEVWTEHSVHAAQDAEEGYVHDWEAVRKYSEFGRMAAAQTYVMYRDHEIDAEELRDQHQMKVDITFREIMSQFDN